MEVGVDDPMGGPAGVGETWREGVRGGERVDRGVRGG